MSSIVQQKEEEEWEWKEVEGMDEDGGMMEENNDEEGGEEGEENNNPSSTRFNVPRPQQTLFPIPSNANNRPPAAHRPRRRFTFDLCAPSSILLLIPALLFVALLAQYSSTPIGGVFGLPGLLRSSQSAVEKMTGQTAGGPQRPLRVMSFNIWVYSILFYVIIFNEKVSGANVENGMEKIANQIKQADPDIVALQVF